MACPLRLPIVLVFVLCQVGCPPVREELDPYEGDPTDDLLVGELRDGAFVAFEPGGEAQWVWGPQGGTMIMPVVSVAAAVAGDERQVQVELRNLPDPAFPDAQGELADFPSTLMVVDLVEVGGDMRSDELFDQLGWMEPSGVQLLLETTVRGEEFAVTSTIALRVADEASGGGGSFGR